VTLERALEFDCSIRFVTGGVLRFTGKRLMADVELTHILPHLEDPEIRNLLPLLVTDADELVIRIKRPFRNDPDATLEVEYNRVYDS
jgi:hypothetical protein